MLAQPTRDKLNALKMFSLASAWEEQNQSPQTQALSFDERLGLLVDAEWNAREQKKFTGRLKDAHLRISQANVEDIDCSAKRQLDRAVIRQLATCNWVEEHQNIIITGATGVGKTFVACALAHQAAKKGYRVTYKRAGRLFEELTLAHADGTYIRFLQRLARYQVLVIDDWGMAPLKDQDRRDIHEIFDDRYGNASTIMTSQMPIAKWHDHLGDPTTADAICDRIIHNAHKLLLQGPSRRKENAKI